MMNKEHIGKRLALLRDELALPGEEPWTQSRLASELGLQLNMIGRLERSGAGSIEAFVTLLIFYLQRGYNINWILLPNNSTISKRTLSESTKTIDAHAVIDAFAQLKQSFVKEVDTAMATLVE
jgi:transcriptional regulator with XRE-family HTH domain